MIFGYIRVSTKQQEKGFSLADQESAIRARYPNAEIVAEVKQGNRQRPEFDMMLKRCLPGDVIVTVDHTRFSRDAAEGLRVARELMDRGILIHFLSFGMLENTPTGRYVLTLLLANAELEVAQIKARTQPAKEKAKQRAGYRDGRPPKYSRRQIRHALDLLQDHTFKQVEELTGISRSTLARAQKAADQEQ